MSAERRILEGLSERQQEIEAQIRAKKQEIAELKGQLQKVKKAQAALGERPDPGPAPAAGHSPKPITDP